MTDASNNPAIRAVQTFIREPLRCDLCGSTDVHVNGAKRGSLTYCKCMACNRTFKVRIVGNRDDVFPTVGN